MSDRSLQPQCGPVNTDQTQGRQRASVQVRGWRREGLRRCSELSRNHHAFSFQCSAATAAPTRFCSSPATPC
jgi:hypothetical protein